MENTHEVYVKLETAELLKKAGFNWKCHASYQNGEFTEFRCSSYFKVLIMDFNNAPDYMNQYSAPTLDVAQRWLREVKNCSILIDVFIHDLDKNNIYCTYNWIVYLNGERYSGSNWDDTRYYEVAQEAGIKKALKLIFT